MVLNKVWDFVSISVYCVFDSLDMVDIDFFDVDFFIVINDVK